MTFLAEVVLMEAEDAQQQHHADQASHRPRRRHVHWRGLSGFFEQREAMRQQVVDGNAEHQAGDKAHGDLGVHVGHGHHRRYPAADQGGADYGKAVGGEKVGGRIHATTLPASSSATVATTLRNALCGVFAESMPTAYGRKSPPRSARPWLRTACRQREPRLAASKTVATLGAFPLPVEVIPMAQLR